MAKLEGEYEYQKYLPQGFTQHPTNILEALQQGQAVLQDEQNWMKGELFANRHPEVDPENAYCNNWQACAMGAVAMVTLGAFRERKGLDWQLTDSAYSYDDEDWELYRSAISLLETVLPSHEVADDREWDELSGGYVTISTSYEVQYEEVWEFNDADDTTHQMVMDTFDRAIAKAEQEELAHA